MSHSRGFSIGAILLLTIIVATTVAALRRVFDQPEVVDDDSTFAVFFATWVTLILSMIVGVAIGRSQPTPVRSVIFGCLAVVATCIAAVPMTVFTESALTLAIGAAILLVVAIVLRLASGGDA